MAAIETHQQAAAAATSDNNDNARPAAKLLDPQLLMAARRGDSKRLKELLLGTNKDDDDSGMEGEAKQVVVVEVDRRRPAEVAPPPLGLLDGDGVTTAEAGDSLLHVVAASGDCHEFLDCATMIHGHIGCKGLLLVARNNKGDTPLHCAAGAGNAHMIRRLVALVTGDDKAVKAFLRLQNHLGETALHHAVRSASKPAIDQLLSLDSELACRCSSAPPCDEGGEEKQAAGADADADAASSPFYLAVSLGEMDIARHLFDASSSRSKRKLSYYSGPFGRNVLHVAVCRGQVLAKVMEWFKDELVDVHAQEEEGEGVISMMSVPLVWQLSRQRDMQQKGCTPLHLAASLDWWLVSHDDIAARPGPAAKLLLDANVSAAYQADDQGSYPIHAAAWAGSLGVVRTLLKRCPDCATLRDGQGRTFLHVAVEQERLRVVTAYAGVRGRLPSLVLNAQEDMNGDTALHVAVRRPENLGVLNCLLVNPQVRLDVANKHGMTPLDLSWTMVPQGFYYILNPRAIVSMTLVAAGAPHGVLRPDLFRDKHLPKRDVVEESKKQTVGTQATSVVTALIATVTFASAFTLPGGYESAGTPVLAGNYAFQAFIFADTLAFLGAIGATCFLVYAGSPAMDLSLRRFYFNLSAFLLQSSARSLVPAFGLALYLALAPVRPTTALVVFSIILAASIFGNVGACDVICMAYTVCARNGILRGLGHTLRSSGAAMIIAGVLLHLGSYIVIFGLPAILKLAR